MKNPESYPADTVRLRAEECVMESGNDRHYVFSRLNPAFMEFPRMAYAPVDAVLYWINVQFLECTTHWLV